MNTLLERAQVEGAPLTSGDTATFLWIGEQAPQVVGDFNAWGQNNSAVSLLPVEPHLWAQTVNLPSDAYVEYAYTWNGGRLLDPLNPRAVADGLGGKNNFFFMPELEPTPLTRVKRGVPRGKITRHVLESDYLIVGGKRTVYLYHPPVSEPCPLLVVFDGREYFRRARLNIIVDNLIDQGRIAPISLAMVEHAGQARYVEYLCSDSTVGFLVRNVLPLAQQELNLVDVRANPGAHGVLGASMGGIMSLYTGLRLPEIFGHVLSQSGGFGIELAGHPAIIYDLIQREAVPPIKIWMDVGRYEWLIRSNQALHALLTEKGYDVTYREYNGAHNYTSWRNDVWRGLEKLYGTGHVS